MAARRTPTGDSATVALDAADAALDAALDDALARVRELSLRLWAVRAVHRPRRGLRGVRCTSCGEPHPCATVQAAEARPSWARESVARQAGCA